jgi:hypothetical protein
MNTTGCIDVFVRARTAPTEEKSSTLVTVGWHVSQMPRNPRHVTSAAVGVAYNNVVEKRN